ncbi:hypothetical protein [Streptomyces griseorubiginosus]|uniref:hypothetical protein n=1 Tax=Streptomyces griseorubiginosus TaxID=67304 RepID=UPI0033E1D00D
MGAGGASLVACAAPQARARDSLHGDLLTVTTVLVAIALVALLLVLPANLVYRGFRFGRPDPDFRDPDH